MATATIKDRYGNTIQILQPGQSVQFQDGWYIQTEDVADQVVQIPNQDNTPTVGDTTPDTITT